MTAQEVDKACDLGTIHTTPLKGKTEKIGDLDIYISEPEKKGDTAVIVVHDIWGFQIPNSKLRGDFLASKGHFAITPDFYHGDPWTAEKGQLGGEDFKKWFGALLQKEDKVFEDMAIVVEYLNKHGFHKIGIIGFCWGGRIVVGALQKGLAKAGVSIHGVLVSAESARLMKGPCLYICSEIDNYVTQDTIAQTKEGIKDTSVIAEFQWYEKVAHGFVNRGDYSNDEHVRKQAEKALDETNKFLSKHL